MIKIKYSSLTVFTGNRNRPHKINSAEIFHSKPRILILAYHANKELDPLLAGQLGRWPEMRYRRVHPIFKLLRLFMNRLILTGNGFDLAHGLKTSYKDFIIWYLNKRFNTAMVGHGYQDDLLRITRASQWDDIDHDDNIIAIKEIADLFQDRGFEKMIQSQAVRLVTNFYNGIFKVNINSAFLEFLLLRCSKAGWVDIENEFYVQLKEILHSKDISDKKHDIDVLNKSLASLIALLQEYLKTLPEIVIDQAYYGIIQSKILKSDMATVHLAEDETCGNIHVLNFNYTSAVQQYFRKEQNRHYEVNYIHGKLDDPNNSLIFGFGDELDEDYLKMEHAHMAGYFAYIKSFWYFKTSNYHNLIRFIDSGAFQVVILGHSCGLSDRTMLNMIFEHENCKSIKIYYYEHDGQNNFNTLTQEISRHFRDKGIMRKKIVPFNRSYPMPQFQP